MKETVQVHGKSFEITVYQKSKSVWEAVGDYWPVQNQPSGTTETIRVTGRTPSGARTAWIRAASYMGN